MKKYFLICKSIFSKCIQCTIYWDKTQMLKKYPSDKINSRKNALFFSRASTHHSFTFNLQFIYELHAFQWILCMRAINRLCKDVLSKIAQVICYSRIIFVTLQLYFLYCSQWYVEERHFSDSEILNTSKKPYGWNSKSMKTKNYVRN